MWKNMCSTLFYKYFAVFIFVFVFLITPFSFVNSGENSCISEGIVVKNLTLSDLWYKKNKGSCFKWKRNKIFNIRSEDSVEIFSDLACATYYCKDVFPFDYYRSFDNDRDCRVRILPNCTISDM